jgi:DNA-directed RNA polymerase specialized sigma24 family protein
MALTLDGYMSAEIADAPQITSEAVRTGLKRARRALAAHLVLIREQSDKMSKLQ